MNQENLLPPPDDDSIDLLDVLLTLAENIKWLILLPLLGGAVAYALSLLLAPKFDSTAVIKADSALVSTMTASHVLDGALKNLGYLEGLDEDEAEAARDNLRKNISASVVRGAKLITITVSERSPSAAQRMAQEILNQVYADSKPRDAEFKRLNAEKSMLMQQASELSVASRTAQKLLDESASGVNSGALAESIAAISANIIKIQTGIHDIDKALEGLSNEDLVQAPTLAKKPSAPNKALIAMVAAVVVGLLVMAWVLLRRSWQSSRTIELHAERLAALKRRYRLG